MLRPLIALTLMVAACAPCPQVECDDLVNVVFAQALAGDYSVEFEGEALHCTGGEPSAEPLLACDGDGFLLRSSLDVLSLSVTGDNGSGSLEEQALTRAELSLSDRPECAVGCSRAEVILALD